MIPFFIFLFLVALAHSTIGFQLHMKNVSVAYIIYMFGPIILIPLPAMALSQPLGQLTPYALGIIGLAWIAIVICCLKTEWIREASLRPQRPTHRCRLCPAHP